MVLNFRVENLASEPLAPGWTLSVHIDDATHIDKQWGWSSRLRPDGRWEGEANRPWQTLACREHARVGGVLTLRTQEASIRDIAVNGEACTLATWQGAPRAPAIAPAALFG